MLNIFFSLFLLGMLVVFMRQGNPPRHAPAAAIKQQGSRSAHSAFAWLSFRPKCRCQRRLQNPAAFLLKRAQPGCRKCGSFLLYAKRGRQQASASLFASYATILFYVLSQKSPLKPFKTSIINSASAN